MEILLIAAVLPVIALCYFIYKKDVHREPTNVLAKLFGFGFLSAIPILFFEIMLGIFFPTEDIDNYILIFINMFVGVALVEEGFKWLVTKKFGYDNNEFDEIYDIIVYSVFASLGFACIENILYVFNYGLINAIMRALLSIPGHTCFGVIMGYFFAQAKVNSINGNKSLYQRNMTLSLLAPCLAHTAYDALLTYMSLSESGYFVLLFFVFDITMVVLCFKTVNRISKIQQNLNTNVASGTITSTPNGQIMYHPEGEVKEVNFCPICGKPVKGYNFCPSCGFKIKL